MTGMTVLLLSLSPRLSLAVGVVGHRFDKIDPQDEAAIGKAISFALSQMHQVLDVIRSQQDKHVYADESPLLSLVSSLAEGADTIAARAALAADWELDAVLPFPVDKVGSEADGTTDRRLLEQARCVMTLPPLQSKGSDTGTKEKAYELAARILLGQSDVLIAVWDGQGSDGRGGTRETIDRAVRFRIPIIHISPRGREVPRLIWSGFDELPDVERRIEDMVRLPLLPLDPGRSEEADVYKLVAGVVLPPIFRAVQKDIDSMRYGKRELNAFRWFRDRQTKRDVAAERESASALREQLAPLLPAELAVNESPAPHAVAIERLVQAFAAADVTAKTNARLFRLAVFGVAFFASAALVSAAAATILGKDRHGVAVGVEIVCILLMIGVTAIGTRFGWHGHWMDAREVAERLRLAVVFWTVGVWPFPAVSAGDGWIDRYVRAYVREQSVFDNGGHPGWVADVRRALRGLLVGQIAYHEDLAQRMNRMNHRLEAGSRLGLRLVIATLLLYAVAFVFPGWVPHWLAEPLHRFEHYLSTWTITLSAVSFMAYILRTTLDFEGIAKRSERMAYHLGHQLEIGDRQGDSIEPVYAYADGLAQIILDDLNRWRTTVESRVLAMP